MVIAGSATSNFQSPRRTPKGPGHTDKTLSTVNTWSVDRVAFQDYVRWARAGKDPIVGPVSPIGAQALNDPTMLGF
jgi:hypothetical protein